MKQLKDFYTQAGISESIFELSLKVDDKIQEKFAEIERLRDFHELRVNEAFHKVGITEASLVGTTGYGYSDLGREHIDQVFAEIFGAEAALVRHQFSSGTHVLATCLKGILRPGDHLLVASGELYDTIKPTIGTPEIDNGSLLNFGIEHTIVDLADGDVLDVAAVLSAIKPNTKMIYVQKSRGYVLRNCLLNEDIEKLTEAVHKKRSDLVVMVDNCYGEFTEKSEPTSFGVDIMAGSLIKNMGGGIAPTGAYVAGRADLVELVAQQMTAPNVGSHIGCSGDYNRLILQGLYAAPGVVAEALKTAVFTSALLAEAGYVVNPKYSDARGDIVQVIELNTPEALISYTAAIQGAAAVNSMYKPEPAPMPGYDCDIIMASGSFIQGSSIELSCDGPLRSPFAAFQQGGLSYAVGRLAACQALQAIAGC